MVRFHCKQWFVIPCRSKSATEESKYMYTSFGRSDAESLVASDSFLSVQQGARPTSDSIASVYPSGSSLGSFIKKNCEVNSPVPSTEQCMVS